jgi:hypothetical protein
VEGIVSVRRNRGGEGGKEERKTEGIFLHVYKYIYVEREREWERERESDWGTYICREREREREREGRLREENPVISSHTHALSITSYNFS